MAKPKIVLQPVEKAIQSRERGIERMERSKQVVRERADKDIAAIDKRIAEKRALLDALKRGAIKA